MKTVIWNDKTIETIRSFPEEVRKEVGYLIYRLQIGEQLNLPHSKSMSSIANGVFELRIKGTDGIYRVFYYTKIKEKVFILHAFQKKTQKTPQHEIVLIKKYLKEMIYE